MSKMQERQNKRIAIVNDFTGFGHCSLMVEVPIISTLGIECCPIPTAIFSNHTGFSTYFFDDYTDKMQSYADEWKKLKVEFDGILIGFLGSDRQMHFVKRFIEEFKKNKGEDAIVIIDPIMGDNGKPYQTYTEEICRQMKQLVRYAQILTPNITEACILTDTPYKQSGWHLQELYQIAEKLCEDGAEKVVISGISMGQYIGNVLFEKEKKEARLLRCKRIGSERCGTGDVFSSIIAAGAVNGMEFEDSVKKSMKFVKECIVVTEQMQVPKTNGVCFEKLLKKL